MINKITTSKLEYQHISQCPSVFLRRNLEFNRNYALSTLALPRKYFLSDFLSVHEEKRTKKWLT